MPTELYELKVLVEADDWRDLSDVMATVDDALEPHRRSARGARRWSVVASRLPAGTTQDLLWFLKHDEGEHATADVAATQMSA